MTENQSNILRTVFLAALALAVGACDANSPTAPVQTPNPPVTSAPSTGFAITVGLNPGTIELGSVDPVTVTVVARRTDTGQFVPQGSTAVLSTSSGTLVNSAGATGRTVALSFDFNGAAQATLNAPAVSAVVRAQIEQSTGEATLTVTEPAAVTPFTLHAVDPNFGPPTGGTEVRIEGTGFSLPASVTIGGVFSEIVSITGEVIRVRTPQIELPAGTNRTVSVVVNINIGDEDEAIDTLTNAFTYTRNQTPLIPKIISVTPTSGPNEGGTQVTIFGEAFGTEVQVFFGAGSRTESRLLNVSPTRILVETPPTTGQNSPNRNSTVPVRVFDLRSGFEATLGGAFQFGTNEMFISAIQPDEGTYFGGDLVTIFGTGFEAPVTVTFGNRTQQPVSVSGTEVVARSVPIETGCNPPPGAVTVVNIETNESVSGPSFLYRTVDPEIGSISPDSTTADIVTGAILAGFPTTLTMTGSGFDRQSRPPAVAFGSEASSSVIITSLDPNPLHEGFGVGDIMMVGIPPAVVPWPEITCTVGNDRGMRYVDQRPEVVVTARDTGCSSAGGVTMTRFTYFPSDPSCRVAPPDPVTPVAQFSFSVAGTTVTVTDLSSNSPTSIQWDFGDGTLENGNPAETRMHNYTGAMSGDTFDVILTASNSAGSGQITKTVTIP